MLAGERSGTEWEMPFPGMTSISKFLFFFSAVEKENNFGSEQDLFLKQIFSEQAKNFESKIESERRWLVKKERSSRQVFFDLTMSKMSPV